MKAKSRGTGHKGRNWIWPVMTRWKRQVLERRWAWMILKRWGLSPCWAGVDRQQQWLSAELWEQKTAVSTCQFWSNTSWIQILTETRLKTQNHSWILSFSHIRYPVPQQILLALLSKYIQSMTTFHHCQVKPLKQSANSLSVFASHSLPITDLILITQPS